MNTGNIEVGGTVRVAVSMANMFQDLMRSLWVKMSVQANGTLPAHVDAANEQHPRHAKRSQAFDLAKAQGKALRRRFDAPGNGS